MPSLIGASGHNSICGLPRGRVPVICGSRKDQPITLRSVIDVAAWKLWLTVKKITFSVYFKTYSSAIFAVVDE